MKKVIIGILGTSEYMKTNDAFYDVYKYSNNYIKKIVENDAVPLLIPLVCLLYTSPSPRDVEESRMPSSA